MNLIKTTQPFEQISIDFKGPLLFFSKNKYLLVVVDEFSCFPFVYSCPDIKLATVIEKLTFCLAYLAFLVMCITIKGLVLCRLTKIVAS